MSDQLISKPTYNEVPYSVQMTIYSSAISLTAPELIATDDSMYVPASKISYIAIENSLFSMIPSAEFEVYDTRKRDSQ